MTSNKTKKKLNSFPSGNFYRDFEEGKISEAEFKKLKAANDDYYAGYGLVPYDKDNKHDSAKFIRDLEDKKIAKVK